jgi:Xaa-Pro aminopeptidase
VVHYAPTPETDAVLEPRGLYLVDSGGQYLDATTDITRTVALGEPWPETREAFTLALKGVIRLAAAVFPEGTKGIALDALARLALWERGLDYGHGTGHGVGSYLCVHEGPQSISPVSGLAAGITEGMLLSIEPGYYREGAFGVRTENLALVVAAEAVRGEAADYLGFETLTLCPIDLRLVEARLLEPREREWLNTYHRRVRAELEPRLEPEVARWLRGATREL